MSSSLENTFLSPDGIPEIKPQDLKGQLERASLIDVRGEGEFVGELGHISGAKLSTLGPDLQNLLATLNKDETYIFVCRSGKRSGTATKLAQENGFKSVFNMTGGMLMWNALGFETEK